MNEQELCRKKLIDLSKQADRKGIVLFSSFLNLDEQNIYHQARNVFATKTESSGGVPGAERQMIAFLPDALCYTWKFPISCLKVTPVNKKFAEELSHRDVLGSLMNLGLERSRLGDILVDEHVIYVFCHEKNAKYIMEELTRIRHTTVCTKLAEPGEISLEPKKESGEGIITSNRLDSIIACLCKISRSQASQWIRGGRVFINNREILQTTYECKEQELISVRSLGRFRFLGCRGETRKGRMKIQYEKYI